MAKVESDVLNTRQTQHVQHQLLNFEIGFEPCMAVYFCTNLNLFARRMQAARPRVQHAAGIAKPRHALAVEQVSVDARHLRRGVGSQPERTPRQLIDELERAQVQVAPTTGQQRLEILEHRRHHHLVAVRTKTIEQRTSKFFNLACFGRQHVGDIFGKQPGRHRLSPTTLIGASNAQPKANEAVRGAALILRTAGLPIEFQGFVEGDDISGGTVDVVVTDGFTGNVALKTAEGAAKLVISFLRNSLTRSLLGKIGAVFASGALGALRRKLDPRASNGGIFLGLNGIVVKSHGGTDALGFASALDMAIDMVKADVISKIVADRARLAAPVPAVASGVGAS